MCGTPCAVSASRRPTWKTSRTTFFFRSIATSPSTIPADRFAPGCARSRTAPHRSTAAERTAAAKRKASPTQMPVSVSDDGGSTVASGPLSGAPLCTTPAPKDAGATSVPEDAGAIDTIVGTWTGYVEAYSFPQSDSDAVVIAFTTGADGTIGGTVTFGNEPAPAPPTSGDEPFPSGFSGDVNSLPVPYEGFPYTATAVSFDGTRLRLGVVSRELWKTWCGFQTSYDWAPNATGNCGCLPNWPSMGSSDPSIVCDITDLDTGVQVPVSCALQGHCLAYPVCDCTAGSCTVDMTQPDVTIDVRLALSQFSGSIAGLTSSPLNVYLMAAP
jgi:hypothetical protein